MSEAQISYTSIDPTASCAAQITSEALVLACSLPSGHDDAFLLSRELAGRFCSCVQEAAVASAMNTVALAELCRELLSLDEWKGWNLSFSVAIRVGEAINVYNCGLNGVLAASGAAGCHAVLSPQTVGRKLRAEGVSDVPGFAASIGAILGTADLRPDAIEVRQIERSAAHMLLVVTDPRLAEALSSANFDNTTIEGVDAVITRMLDTLINPRRSFALWWPRGEELAPTAQSTP